MLLLPLISLFPSHSFVHRFHSVPLRTLFSASRVHRFLRRFLQRLPSSPLSFPATFFSASRVHRFLRPFLQWFLLRFFRRFVIYGFLRASSTTISLFNVRLLFGFFFLNRSIWNKMPSKLMVIISKQVKHRYSKCVMYLRVLSVLPLLSSFIFLMSKQFFKKQTNKQNKNKYIKNNQ